MSVENRVIEILRMVDEMLRRITKWMNDPNGGPVVPEDVRLGIHSAAMTCGQGDIPECCRDLAIIAVPRLHEEYRGYSLREIGKVRLENGAPWPSFWAAAKAAAIARAGSDAPVGERLEPVSVLLEQGVTHDQIARHIYGRRGVGPFIQANGAPDIGLIEKEAHEPGSVIPEGWVPPWLQETLKRRQMELASKLSAFDRLECAKRYDDPATVEEMIRDGAFVQQIERAKGVTRDVVMAAAQRIGVTPVDGPGYHLGIRDVQSFDDDDDDDVNATLAADREALRSLVIELYTKYDGSKGANEIASEVRLLGHDITTNGVAAMICHWKKRQSRSVAAAAS